MTEEPANSYVETLELEGLAREPFIALAVEAVLELEWLISPLTDTGFTAYTNNGENAWNAEITIAIDNNTVTLTCSSTNTDATDTTRLYDTAGEFIATVVALEEKLSIEELTRKYEHLKAEFARLEQDPSSAPQLEIESGSDSAPLKMPNFLSLFVPTESYLITPILALLNIAIFILMVLAGDPIFTPTGEDLLPWGANFRPLTLDGSEWWRLITSFFIHGGILHLLVNISALIYIGIFLEPLIGYTRFFVAYMLAGLAGNMTNLWWHESVVSAGASGAIFGMYGVFLAMLMTGLIDEDIRKKLLISTASFVGLNLLLGFIGNTDVAALIGGLAGGMLMGYAYTPSLKNPDDTRLDIWSVTAPTVVILASAFFVYSVLPHSSIRYAGGLEKFFETEKAAVLYAEGMKEFFENQSKAVESADLSVEYSQEAMLLFISSKNAYWERNLSLLDRLNSLQLPDTVIQRNDKLREYCILRIQFNNLYYRAIEEDQDQNSEEFIKQSNSYIARIEAMIRELRMGQNQ